MSPPLVVDWSKEAAKKRLKEEAWPKEEEVRSQLYAVGLSKEAAAKKCLMGEAYSTVAVVESHYLAVVMSKEAAKQCLKGEALSRVEAGKTHCSSRARVMNTYRTSQRIAIRNLS